MLKVKSRRSARGLREELADTASVNLYSSWTNAESFWSFRFFVGGRGASMFGGGDGGDGVEGGDEGGDEGG